MIAASPTRAGQTEPINLPLDTSASTAHTDQRATGIALKLAMEARARQESYANALWAADADDGYLWLRLMPSADVSSRSIGMFVQPMVGYALGVSGGPGPVDQTGIDMLQAYIDLRLPLGADASVTVRAGRALVALGSERLVGRRYGPNVPQAFDGVRVTGRMGSLQLDLIDAHPVEVGPASFDDRSSRRRHVRAVYARMELDLHSSADLYWIGYRDIAARFGQRSGVEHRDTFGLRLFGKHGALSWNWETMVQRGNFAGRRISAWSQATETSLALTQLPLDPVLRVRANYASGDRNDADGAVGTFNAMFPKGRYFGELTPIGPRNIINFNPSVAVELSKGVDVELAAAVFWRASRHDGLYDLPGREIRSAGGSRARHVGNQVEATVNWTLAQSMTVSGSLATFSGGSFLKETGEAQRTYMAGIEAMWSF